MNNSILRNTKVHPPRNIYLDGLRGYASLVVLIFHGIILLDPYILSHVLHVPIHKIDGNYYKLIKFILLIFDGHTAVSIFFVLSGMVLFQSLIKNNNAFIITFSLKRIIRIYAPLIPCLFVFYFVFNMMNYFFSNLYPGFITVNNLIENCLLYKIFYGATWTLKLEIIVIPLMLLTFYFYKKTGIKSLLIFTALSILALDNNLKINFSSTNIWLYYFYLGFLCAVFQKNAKTIAKNFGWLLPLCIILFLRSGFIGNPSITSNLLQGFSIAALIMYLSSNPKDIFSSFLKLPFSQYLGKISFSLYLWHWILLLFTPLQKIPFLANHPLEFGLFIAILTFIITWPIAHYSEKFIEQPSIKLGKKLSEQILLVLPKIRPFIFRAPKEKLAE